MLRKFCFCLLFASALALPVVPSTAHATGGDPCVTMLGMCEFECPGRTGHVCGCNAEGTHCVAICNCP
jgi:hypothetical protein